MAVIIHSWKDDPLEYLVRVEFPLERAYLASFPSLNTMRPASRDEDYLQRAAKFREELQKTPHSELLERAEAASRREAQKAIERRDAEEAGRFFNIPSASTDVSHWSRMSLWSLDEAAALSFGKDPRQVNWDRLKNIVHASPFAARYQAQREIFSRAKLAGQLWDSTTPGLFLAWAERMNIEIPPSLVDAVKALGVQIRDWKSAYDEQKIITEKAKAETLEVRQVSIKSMADQTAHMQKMTDGYSGIIDKYKSRVTDLEQKLSQAIKAVKTAPVAASMTKEKSLGARERESLLKLVIGMAVEAYKYDPKASRSEIIKEIAGDLEKAGISLDADTVRKYLHEARDLLPPPETERKR